MYLRHLGLVNYRNYRRLDLDLPPGISVFWGDNGQGKSNLLEAIYLLATSRSFRTSAERELVNWYADTSPVFARVAGDVVRHQATTRLEVILAEPPTAPESAAAATSDRVSTEAGQAPATTVRRRVRIGGQERSVAQLLGHLNTVVFSPEDVALIAGPAELRRRYFDITLCQVDQRYLRTLRRYVRVLQQRNALLRQLRDRPAPPDQFEYWDAQVVELGSDLIVARLRAVDLLNTYIESVYPRLTSDPHLLRIEYRSTVPLAGAGEGGDDSPRPVSSGPAEEALIRQVRERFAAHLALLRPRERQLAVTLAGPHRDDATFLIGPIDLRAYGSRGQQRTAALALKLSEVHLMERYTGERPVLLLDDVLSELDPTRRHYLQETVTGQEQVLITATDLAPFEAGFLARAARYRIAGGAVTKEA